jgi:hypothetical protein
MALRSCGGLNACTQNAEMDRHRRLAYKPQDIVEAVDGGQQRWHGRRTSKHRAETVHITLLFIFKTLRDVTLNVGDGVWLTPDQAATIPTAWPEIQTFHSYNYGRIPRINHTHLLEVAFHCLHLRSLSLSFDACQIRGEERHLSPAGITPPPLVGNSPIESPDNVVS